MNEDMVSTRTPDEVAPKVEPHFSRGWRWLVLLAVLGLGAVGLWMVNERGDSISGEAGAGTTTIAMRTGDVFAASYGPYSVEEPITLTRVGLPDVADAFAVKDTRILIGGSGSAPKGELPHGCEAIGLPSSAAGDVLGDLRSVDGVELAVGDWFYVVAYLEASRPGLTSTEAPVRIEYKQRWLTQSQMVLDQGVYVEADVSPDHESLPAGLACHVS